MSEKELAVTAPGLAHGMEYGQGFVNDGRPIGMDRIEEHADWPVLSRIPMRLRATIPLPRFRVRDLLLLKPGQTIESTWLSTDDVPLRVGTVQMSWSEFEVVEQRMAVRLTRLA